MELKDSLWQVVCWDAGFLWLDNSRTRKESGQQMMKQELKLHSKLTKNQSVALIPPNLMHVPE